MNASADNVVSPAVAEVNSLVDKGLRALDEFLKLDQEQIDFIVAKASIAALDKHGVLAMHAVEETGRGVFEDKANEKPVCLRKRRAPPARSENRGRHQRKRCNRHY